MKKIIDTQSRIDILGAFLKSVTCSSQRSWGEYAKTDPETKKLLIEEGCYHGVLNLKTLKKNVYEVLKKYVQERKSLALTEGLEPVSTQEWKEVSEFFKKKYLAEESEEVSNSASIVDQTGPKEEEYLAEESNDVSDNASTVKQ